MLQKYCTDFQRQDFFFQAWNAFLLQPEQDVACLGRFARYLNPATGTSHHIKCIFVSLQQVFLPDGYPRTVSKDYLEYQVMYCYRNVASTGNTSRCGTLSKHSPPP